MPHASSSRACSGRPPAISAKAGGSRFRAASCSARSSRGAKPRMPAPNGRAPSIAAGVAEQRTDLLGGHQREGQKRQCARLGDGEGERLGGR